MSHVRIQPSKLLAAERSGKIDLHSQSLTRIPPEIWNLKNITHADFSNNRLTSIDPDICNFAQLHTLNLECNAHLTFLPAELSACSQLRYINLYGCDQLPGPIVAAYKAARSAPIRIGDNFRSAREVVEAVKLYHIEQHTKQVQNTPSTTATATNEYGDNNNYNSYNTSANPAYGNSAAPSAYDRPYYSQQQDTGYSSVPPPAQSGFQGVIGGNSGVGYEHDLINDDDEAPFDDPEEEAEYQRYKMEKLREFQLQQQQQQMYGSGAPAYTSASAAYPSSSSTTTTPYYQSPPHTYPTNTTGTGGVDSGIMDEEEAARQREIEELEAACQRLKLENEARLQRLEARKQELRSYTPVPQQTNTTSEITYDADVQHMSSYTSPQHHQQQQSAQPPTPQQPQQQPYVNINQQPRPSPFATHENITNTYVDRKTQLQQRRQTPVDVSRHHTPVNTYNSREHMLQHMKSDIFNQDVSNNNNSNSNGMGSPSKRHPGHRYHGQRDHDIFGTNTPTTTTTTTAPGTPGSSAHGGMYTEDGALVQPRPRHVNDSQIFTNDDKQPVKPYLGKKQVYPGKASQTNVIAHTVHQPSKIDEYQPYHNQITSFLQHQPHVPSATATTNVQHNAHLQTRGGAVALALGGSEQDTEAVQCNTISGGDRKGITGKGYRKLSSQQYQSHISVDKTGFTVVDDEHTLEGFKKSTLARPSSGRAITSQGVSQRQGHSDLLQDQSALLQQQQREQFQAPGQQYVYGQYDSSQISKPQVPPLNNYQLDTPLYDANNPNTHDTQHQQQSSRPQSGRRGFASSYDLQYMHHTNATNDRYTPVTQSSYKHINDQYHGTPSILNNGYIPPSTNANIPKHTPITTEDFNSRVNQSTAKDLAQRNRSSNIF